MHIYNKCSNQYISSVFLSRPSSSTI